MRANVLRIGRIPSLCARRALAQEPQSVKGTPARAKVLGVLAVLAEALTEQLEAMTDFR